jgi:histidinol-phosphate aminotransferase
VDKNSKLVFICSPNNPTGNTITAHKIEELLNTFEGLVVIDEAYIDFSSEQSWVAKLSEYPNLVVTQTLSKAYGMAGIRLGICIASEEVIGVLNKIKPPYNVNELTQQRAKERVSNEKVVQKEITAILKERQLLKDALEGVSFVTKVYPSDANFILAKVDDASIRYQQLLEKGIVVRNRTTQPLCENTLRFTVGTPDENKTLIKALKSIV